MFDKSTTFLSRDIVLHEEQVSWRYSGKNKEFATLAYADDLAVVADRGGNEIGNQEIPNLTGEKKSPKRREIENIVF